MRPAALHIPELNGPTRKRTKNCGRVRRLGGAGIALLVAGATLGPLPQSATSEDPAGCETTKRIAVIRIAESRYPKTADHIDDAARAGQPRRLTLERDGADERREEATAGTQSKPGYDKDEYPPALSRQGGKGADVRLVPSSDNRGAGASMGNQLRRYCDGQRFRLATPQT